MSIPCDSSPHVTPQCLASIEPSPSGKKNKHIGPQRNELRFKFANPEALVKHIVAGAVVDGLDGLPARVPLTLPASLTFDPFSDHFESGIPLHPTLGPPARPLDGAYDQPNEMPFTAEFKYDGQRAQIHALKVASRCPSIHFFSRHLEYMTDKVKFS